MAATISADMDNTDKAVTFLNEARALGIVVQPPDVNASQILDYIGVICEEFHELAGDRMYAEDAAIVGG
ncbi:hypothetical protein RLIN73S_06830 [Rhodanobacter lindaniclasticus]